MVGSAITSGNGVVLINIPEGGLTGEVLTKLSNEDYDYDWQPGGGGGAPTNAEYVVMSLDATLTDERVLTAGSGITIVDGGAGGNVTISVDVATLNPLLDHGLLLGLADDDHLQYLLLAGRAGGQTAFGGTAASEILTLQGTSAANRGTTQIQGRMDIDFDWTTDVGVDAITWNNTIPASGAVVASALLLDNTVTVNAGTFILSAVRDLSDLEWTVSPGFAVSTLFLAQSRYFSTTVGIPPAQAFIYAAQPTFESFGAGAITVGNYRGNSTNAILRARNAGDNLTTTNNHGLTHTFLWNTNNATAIVDAGNSAAVKVLNPSQVLFGQSLGTERCVNFYGIDYDNITIATTGERAVVHSSLVASGTTNFFLKNDGGAPSQSTGGIQFGDSVPVQFGGAGFNSQDVSIFWNNAAAYLEFFFTNTSDFLGLSSPVAGQFLLEGNAPATDEIYFDFRKAAFFQSSAIGNQKMVFAAKAETVTVAGEYSQYLLTQSANDTIDAALSLYAGWTINAPSPTIGTGSLTTGVALNVGGNPSTASVNRVGVRIISNPSGGSGINAALWVTAGLSRFDGRVDINNGIALGGGAVATLGTIGGSGPTAAAQAQWMEVDIGGTAHWIPVWT